jgi:cardiolipin synthase
VVDRNPVQVSAISRTFAAEWSGQSPQTATVPAAGQVWSPDALSTILRLVGSAHRSVLYTSEELTDRPLIQALEADARKGDTCTIILPSPPEDQAALRAAGCHVTVVSASATYMHEKSIVIDGQTAFLGSQKGSSTSLTKNRELGIITTDRTVVQEIQSGLPA